MNAAQLRTALRQLGVTPPDELRASLYLQQLRDTQTFFSAFMASPNGMGSGYSFVKAAVTSSNLVFYHRIGTQDLVDSQGRLVAIPVQININGGMENTNIGRATFFANQPTTTTVRQGQLQLLRVDPGFTQRCSALRTTVLQGLNRHGVPRRPETLIP